LKQSSKQLYKQFNKFMCGKRYTRSPHDLCLFQQTTTKWRIYLLTVVCRWYAHSFEEQIVDQQVEEPIVIWVPDEGLGEATILGMEINKKTEKRLDLFDSKGFLQKVLQKFNIQSDTKSVNTPLTPHFKLATTMSLKIVEEREYVSHTVCQWVGSLMYGIVRTRPDLSLSCKHGE